MKTTIKVTDYYGNTNYYSVMPEPIFDALEAAWLSDEEFSEVEKDMLDRMIEDYEKKMKR